MKKTILSLLSMAFISAMTLTSCDEIMSKMDNPVDSYLKVDAEVFVKEGSAVELYAETISDAEVTYTVGDEKIAKVEKVSNHEVKVIGRLAISSPARTTSLPTSSTPTRRSSTHWMRTMFPRPSPICTTSPSPTTVMARLRRSSSRRRTRPLCPSC